METLVEKMFETFSLEYMFSTIICAYLILKLVDNFNGSKVVPTWLKRVITCEIGAVLFVVFARFTDTTTQCLITSFFAAIFVYDTAIKTILKKLNIDYRS